MTTKEFIKMLQESDPEGTAHIRMSGGIPIYVERKPGYWDGSYDYFDDDGNWVTSTKGVKVDIYTKDIDDFIFDEVDCDVSFEEIKSKIKFDMDNMLNLDYKESKIKSFLDEVEKSYNNALSIYNKVFKDGLNNMVKNAKVGWRWFQDKRVDSDEPGLHYYYTWKIYNESGELQGSNVHMTESVMKSGLWEKCDNNVEEGYYEWIFRS